MEQRAARQTASGEDMSLDTVMRAALLFTFSAPLSFSMLASAVLAQRAQSETSHVRCLQRRYDYQLYAPDAPTPLPAILLLHGAGGRSSDLVDC